MESSFNEIKFSDKDVINIEDAIFNGDYNPNKVAPYLIHDHGSVIAVVFASSMNEALDIAVDKDKLDAFLIDPSDKSDRDDYMTSDFSKAAGGLDEKCPEFTDKDGVKYWWSVEPAFLGNASEPFDIESIGIEKMPVPQLSFCALFNAHQERKKANAESKVQED